MASEKEVSKIDTEDFINEIEKCSAIWNSTIDAYSDRIAKRNAWSTVISHFFPDFEEKSPADKKSLGTLFQRRWKSLREGYTRENLKRKEEQKSGSAAKGRKSYVYYEQLRFLEPITKPTKTSMGSDNSEREGNEDVDLLQEQQPEEMEGPFPKQRKTTKGKKEDPDELLLQTLKANCLQRSVDANDPDRLFLLSMVPDLKSVPDFMKIEAKTRLMAVFSQVRQEVRRMNVQQHPSQQPFQQHPSQHEPFQQRPPQQQPYQQPQQPYYNYPTSSQSGNYGGSIQAGLNVCPPPTGNVGFGSQFFSGGTPCVQVNVPVTVYQSGPSTNSQLSPTEDTFSSTSSELDFSVN